MLDWILNASLRKMISNDETEPVWHKCTQIVTLNGIHIVLKCFKNKLIDIVGVIS